MAANAYKGNWTWELDMVWTWIGYGRSPEPRVHGRPSGPVGWESAWLAGWPGLLAAFVLCRPAGCLALCSKGWLGAWRVDWRRLVPAGRFRLAGAIRCRLVPAGMS